MAYRAQTHLQSILACPACGGTLAWQSANAECLGCGLPVSRSDGAFVFHTADLPENFDRPEYTSSNPYHRDCLALIEKYPEGAVLNYGAGNPRFAFDNVIELEIRRYPNTDLVAGGSRLPLRDETLDGVISLSVLEHVKDPFRYLAEIHRVLKPGGDLVIHAAFMQPFHAFPDHYFNATKAGLTRLLEGFAVEEVQVGDHQHPWITLRLVLNGYLHGLTEAADRRWLREQRVGDLLDRLNQVAEQRSAIKGLDDPVAVAHELGTFNTTHADDLGPLLRIKPQTRDNLAAGFAALATKKRG
jgi:SAM-dependent methyltransferase